jgi:spore germination protein KC
MGCRVTGVIFLLFAVLVISGCNGGRETDEVAYVIGIGIDRAENDQINITYQIAIPKALSSSGGGDSGTGGNGSKAVTTLTIRTYNIAEARNILTTLIARMPNLSHNKVFFIGEALAREGVADIFGPLVRYREYRGSMFIAVVHDGTAEKYLKQLNPKLEVLPSKFIETMLMSNNETGYYVRSDLQEFYGRLKSSSGSPYAALVATNLMNGENRPSGEKLPDEKVSEYLAGDIPAYDSIPASQFAGTALFRQDKMVGTLTTEETRMLLILQGNFPHGFIVITDPNLSTAMINVNLRLGEKPTTNVSFVDGHPVIAVSVLLEGDLTAIPSGINYEQQEYRQQLEGRLSALIQAQIEKMLNKTQVLDSDVVGFGYQARTAFPTYQAWEDQNWDELYSKAQFQIKVTTKLRRTGLMWRSVPIGGKKGK